MDLTQNPYLHIQIFKQKKARDKNRGLFFEF
jgi:hypothetical protein